MKDKKCKACKQVKNLTEFYKENTPGGYKSECKLCYLAHRAKQSQIPKTKLCSKCKIVKNSSDFLKRKDSVDGLRHICTSCWHNYAKSRKNKKPTIGNKTCNNCKRTLPYNNFGVNNQKKDGCTNFCYTCATIKRYKDLSFEKYQEMMKKADGICCICMRDRMLVIDHCHKTQKVRGLICSRCNANLGVYKENKQTFENFNRYLKGEL